MSQAADISAERLQRAVKCHQAGQIKEASRLYKQVLKVHPTNFLANNYLGRILLQEHKYDKALTCFKKALTAKPGWAEARINIARAAFALKDYKSAEENVRKALAASPDHYGALIVLGDILFSKARYEDALHIYQQASAAQPSNAEPYNCIGGVYASQEKYEQARPWFEKALRCQPAHARAWNNLGVALRYLHNYEDALKAFDMAIKCSPDYVSPRANKCEILTFLSRSAEIIDLYQPILDRPELTPSMYSNYLMALHYAPGVDMQFIFNAQKEWGRRYANGNKPKYYPQGQGLMPGMKREKGSSPVMGNGGADEKNEKITNKNGVAGTTRTRTRIGLVSSGFCRHPVGYMILPAVQNMNKDKYEFVFYSDMRPEKKDDLTALLDTAGSGWYDVRDIDDTSLARKIRDERIDILFDLSGHADGGRLGMFGYRPAPIQVEWVGGLFGTSGILDMDWILADSVEIPPGDEKWYTEKIYRMPDNYICYAPPHYLPECAEAPALKNGCITFANFNNAPKTNDKSINLWAQVLKGVPESRMMLKNRIYGMESARQDVLDKFDLWGIPPERIIFRQNSSHKEHLEALNEVDIALDPYPYTGGLTTCENLCMGVPVITLPGPHFAGRHSATHLTAAGYPDFIARDERHYVELARHLAIDIKRLAELRQEMRGRIMRSPLTDGKRFAANLDTALSRMIAEKVNAPGEKKPAK